MHWISAHDHIDDGELLLDICATLSSLLCILFCDTTFCLRFVFVAIARSRYTSVFLGQNKAQLKNAQRERSCIGTKQTHVSSFDDAPYIPYEWTTCFQLEKCDDP